MWLHWYNRFIFSQWMKYLKSNFVFFSFSLLHKSQPSCAQRYHIKFPCRRKHCPLQFSLNCCYAWLSDTSKLQRSHWSMIQREILDGFWKIWHVKIMEQHKHWTQLVTHLKQNRCVELLRPELDSSTLVPCNHNLFFHPCSHSRGKEEEPNSG